MPSKCLGRSNRSNHGGRLPRLQSIENRSRQPVLWVPPTALESAIEHTRPGAEQRARTTGIAIQPAAQNGTYLQLPAFRGVALPWADRHSGSAREAPESIVGSTHGN